MPYPTGLLDAIDAFLAGVRVKAIGDSETVGTENVAIETEAGPRYIRVIRTLRNKSSWQVTSRSAYCFIDKTNGDVLKPAGWKTPAKGKRSNIFDATNGLSGVGPYGANYLR